jgi:hypothetical protein
MFNPIKATAKTIAIILGSIFLLSGTALAATVLLPIQGGTGTATKPVYGQVLVGNAGGTYTPTATSSLGISGGGGNNYASTTIGDGTQIGGLTTSGGSTTTLNAYIGANLAVGLPTTASTLYVKGTTNVASLQAVNAVGNKFLTFGYADGSLNNYGNFQIQSSTLVLQGGTASQKIQITPYNSNVYNTSLGLNVDSTGNVGIGTTTLSRLFNVQGNSLFSGDISAANVIATGTLNVTGTVTTGASIQVGGNALYIDGSVGKIFIPGSSGFLGFTTNTVGVSASTMATTLSQQSAGVFEVGSGTTVNANGALLLAKIGIGSTTPAFPLSVHAKDGQVYSGNTLFAIGSSTSIATTSLFTVDNQGNTFLGGALTINGIGGTGGITGPNTFQIANTGGGSLRFVVNATQIGLLGTGDWRMAGNAPLCFTAGTSVGSAETCIGRSAPGVTQLSDSSGALNNKGQLQTGSIGLSTTTPFAKLAISLNDQSTMPGNFAFLIASSTASATTTLFSIDNKGTVNLHTSVSSSDPDITIGPAGVGTGMVLASGGVGFQTANANFAVRINGGNVGTGVQIYQSGSVAWGAGNSSPDAYLARTGINKLSLGISQGGADATLLLGTIGVGSTSPAFPLSVHAKDGQVFSGNTLFAIGSSTASATTTLFSVSNTGVVNANSLFMGTLNGLPSISADPTGVVGGTIQLTGTGFKSLRNASVNFTVDGSASATLVMNNNNSLGFAAGTGVTDTTFTRLSANTLGLGALHNSTDGTLLLGGIGVGTTTPFYSFTSSSTIASAEYRPATTTSQTINWAASNQEVIRLGGSATTMSFANVLNGATHRVIVCNPNQTAGAITWPAGILWSEGTPPVQTTTANKCDVYSFIATAGSSTVQTILGAATVNF